MSTDTDAGHPADRTDDAPRPADAYACGALGCRRDDDLQLVVRDDGKSRVLCPVHSKYFLGVSS